MIKIKGEYFLPIIQGSDDLDTPLMVQLVKAMNWAHQNLQMEIEKSGAAPFNINQGIVLSNILLGINRPSDLAREMEISRQAVSIILKQLEGRGIIELIADPQHKLAKIVRMLPNDENEGILDVIHHARNVTEARLKKRIGAVKFKTLRAALGSSWGPIGEYQKGEKNP